MSARLKFGVAAIALSTIASWASCAIPNTSAQTSAGGPSALLGDQSGGTIKASCIFNGRQLLGDAGAVFQVACPPACAERAGLWGTDIYTVDSGICVAGIHAGAIAPAGGIVLVRLDVGQLAYRGSLRNGITSGDHGSSGGSFTVAPQGGQPATAPAAIQAGCSFNSTQIKDALGTAHLVSCPSGCAARVGLWGTDVYAGDSAICRAAIHAGLTSDRGGNVVVILDGPQPAFRGSLRNGVWSGDYGRSSSSFHLQPAQ